MFLFLVRICNLLLLCIVSQIDVKLNLFYLKKLILEITIEKEPL